MSNGLSVFTLFLTIQTAPSQQSSRTSAGSFDNSVGVCGTATLDFGIGIEHSFFPLAPLSPFSTAE